MAISFSPLYSFFNQILKKGLVLILCSLIPLVSFSQNMIISGNATVKVHDGGKIIFSNSAPNNIQKSGSLGGILMMGENSEIIFKNVNQLGDYFIPYASSQGNTIPFTFSLNTLASNSGDIHFTTWETNVNNIPYPSSVTHMTDASGLDNTSKVINRFWKIDMVNYGSKPKGDYEFTYDDYDLAGTLINESGLVAQRWNSDDLLWGDWLYSPTANVTTNKVNIMIRNPEDEYSVWTLVDQADPLPIELVRFLTNCRSGFIEWTTFTETNSSHFEVQMSDDAIDWLTYEIIPSSINSNTPVNYSISNPNKLYYRLKSVDLDNEFDYSPIIINDCHVTDIGVNVNPTLFSDNIMVTNNSGKILNAFIIDSQSKLVYHSNNVGSILDLSYLASGIYTMVISDGYNNEIIKLIKR